MKTTTRPNESTAAAPVLFMSFELGETKWKLGFSTAPAQRPRLRTMPAREPARVLVEISLAKARFGLPTTTRVVSCYEAGRDGFWLHRFLTREGVENYVVDASSIEVNRRARRAKTDRLDATKLLLQLMRFLAGERRVWSVVRVPTVRDEDQRQLHRTIEALRKDRGRVVSRINGLLATQGVSLPVTRHFDMQLAAVRLWDGGSVPSGLQQRLRETWAQWQLLTGQIAALERLRDSRLDAGTDPVSQQVRHLRRLRGLDESAWVFVTEAFAWRDFQNGRQVGAFTGLAPTPYDSGGQRREQGISKSGSRRLRATAIQIAWAWLRYQPHSRLAQWFNDRYARGGGRARRVGIVAVARKLLIALWRYLQTGLIPDGAILKAAA
jgi:transposase